MRRTKFRDRGALVRRVLRLRMPAGAAFAVACGERLWPLVVRYGSVVGTPSDTMTELRDGLDTLWRAVNGDGGDVARVHALAEALLPPDDPWVDESGYAEDGLATIIYAAEALLSGDRREAGAAAGRVYDAADAAAQLLLPDSIDSFTPEAEKLLRESTVVRAAVAVAHADLDVARRGDLVGLREQSRSGAEAFTALFP
ncbi:MAG: hypothetical protein LBJ08_01455 [Bifidobacteriaceae bacterium]|jgi:hypothetical protein|nr:hypothetical protein [Bifidobacteriaceae bacterium]